MFYGNMADVLKFSSDLFISRNSWEFDQVCRKTHGLQARLLEENQVNCSLLEQKPFLFSRSGVSNSNCSEDQMRTCIVTRGPHYDADAIMAVYLNLARNNFYILFPAKYIMSCRNSQKTSRAAQNALPSRVFQTSALDYRENQNELYDISKTQLQFRLLYKLIWCKAKTKCSDPTLCCLHN